MFSKKTLAHVILGVLFFQLSFAQESQEEVVEKISTVSNNHSVHVRTTPGLDGEKTYIVLDGISGEVVSDEVQKDDMTWVQVKYNQYVTGWVHKELLSTINTAYTSSSGVKYTVYYTHPDNALYLAGEEVGDIILSSAGEEEIVWITSDFRRAEPIHINRAWGKNSVEYIDGEEVVEEEEVLTSIISNFGRPTDIKVHYPWNIPEEIVESIDGETTYRQQAVIITTSLRKAPEIKVHYPWVKEFIPSTTINEDGEEESSIAVMNTVSFRGPPEIKVHYPWVKDFTPSTSEDIEEETLVEKVIDIVTSTFRKAEPIHVSYPWNTPEDIVYTEDAEEEQEYIPSSITTDFPPEKPTGWTTDNFLNY